MADDNMPAFKQALRIDIASKYVASYISVETKIKSDLLYFEETFLFYFLNNVSLSIVDAPASTTTHVLPELLGLLAHENYPGYKENKDLIEKLIHKRFKMYFDIMYKYSEKLTPDFFTEAFNYQAVCINNIKLYNSLLDPDTLPLSLSEWIVHISEKNNLDNIIESLNDNYKLFVKFVSRKAFEKKKKRY